MSKRSKGKPALGQSLVTHGGALRPGATSGRKERRERARTRHSTLDGHDGGVGGGGSKGFTSVLEVSDLAEIMLDAELSDRSFAASRGPVLLNKSATNTKVEKVRRLSEADRDVLRLPRRPQWNTNMSAAHLEKLEREAFLHWRRGLAAVEESSHKIMTPFEKNLDIWRQLWRVVEKSDVLIQIVDGRDPLLFYCEDLVRYVAELSTEERPKQCLVLMNKADLVPGALLPEWQEYFRAQDMPVLFFSAVESAAPRQDDVGAEEESAPAVEALEFPSGTDIVQQEREDYAKLCVSESEESGEDVKICTTEELLEEFHNMMPAWKAARRSELGAEERKVHPADSRVVIGMVGYPNVGKSSTINAIIVRSSKQARNLTSGLSPMPRTFVSIVSRDPRKCRSRQRPEKRNTSKPCCSMTKLCSAIARGWSSQTLRPHRLNSSREVSYQSISCMILDQLSRSYVAWFRVKRSRICTESRFPTSWTVRRNSPTICLRATPEPEGSEPNTIWRTIRGVLV